MSEVNGRHEAVTTEVNPAVTPQARSIVYIIALAVDVLTILVMGLGVIFGLIDSMQAAAASGVIVLAINTVSSALSVGYRPTRPGA